jgi:hypothetical protein
MGDCEGHHLVRRERPGIVFLAEQGEGVLHVSLGAHQFRKIGAQVARRYPRLSRNIRHEIAVDLTRAGFPTRHSDPRNPKLFGESFLREAPVSPVFS